jgi:hypothetical protein
MPSINSEWSQPPSHVSGAANAAGYVGPSRPTEDRSMRLVGSDPSRRQAPTPQQQPQADATANPAADAYGAIINAAREFGQHLQVVDQHRGQLSDDGVRAHIAAFADSHAAKAVDSAVADVRARRDAAAAKRDSIFAGLSPDGDAAAELRATRDWNRAKAILDRADDGVVGTTARKAIANADPAERGVLIRELPGYCEARGVPADWLDAAVTQAVPELAAADREYRAAERAAEVVDHDAKVLKRALAEGRAPDPRTLVDPTAISP